VNDLAEWRVVVAAETRGLPGWLVSNQSAEGRESWMKATSLLFDLDGFQVVSVAEVDGGYREALVAGVTREQACPDCGVFGARVHSRPVSAGEGSPKITELGASYFPLKKSLGPDLRPRSCV
jgi:hypothetical protein